MERDYKHFIPATLTELRAVVNLHRFTGYLLVGYEERSDAAYVSYFCTACEVRFRATVKKSVDMEFRCPKCRRPSLSEIIRKGQLRRRLSWIIICAMWAHVAFLLYRAWTTS